MKSSVIAQLHRDFEMLVQTEEDTGIEFWMARDLQEILGYAKWENFAKVVDKARTACMTSGYDESDHFLDVRKMVSLGSGAAREIDDVMLTRYACYLIAQNGDPSKDAIAFAQTYFAVQTRKQEMKKRLDVPKNRPLADFLPTITIKAKDFANEITTFSIKRDGLDTEDSITHEHVKNNADVRELLGKRNIKPESLPPGEDAKKIERRLKSEEKKLPRSSDTLEHKDRDA